MICGFLSKIELTDQPIERYSPPWDGPFEPCHRQDHHVTREEFLTRIRAAVIARDQIPGGSDFVIIGRTDSAQVLGMEEAVTRLKLAADAGADVCFIEGVKSKDLLEKTVAALAPKPVLVNVISGGLTPSFTCKEAEEMGAKIISKCLTVVSVLY